MTWFEVQVDTELALVLDDIARAYAHRGKASRAAFIERLKAAIPAPSDDGTTDSRTAGRHGG